jgi:ABC-type branched-subunit amino acid transport system ATPase component
MARVKGVYATMSWKEAEEQVDSAIQDVALSEKRNTLAKNLSGGMKRKLSVAIAFCGGSKVVLLDEPTSGTSGLWVCNADTVDHFSQSSRSLQAWIPSVVASLGM